jgi:multimeric flavodoxin WrbA
MRANKTNAALLFDGRTDDEATLALVHEVLVDGLVAGGWTVDDWRLRDEKMAWCTGCFGCWVKTPGVCVHTDAGRAVNARAERADLLVFLTPITFGGYSAELKKALDHGLGLHLPQLRKLGVDTHHPARYERVHDVLAVGTVPAGQADGPEARTFRRLVQRNILNLPPGRQVTGVVESGAGRQETRAAIMSMLAETGVRHAATVEPRREEVFS